MCPLLHLATPTVLCPEQGPDALKCSNPRQECSSLDGDESPDAKDDGGDRKALVCDVQQPQVLASDLTVI